MQVATEPKEPRSGSPPRRMQASSGEHPVTGAGCSNHTVAPRMKDDHRSGQGQLAVVAAVINVPPPEPTGRLALPMMPKGQARWKGGEAGLGREEKAADPSGLGEEIARSYARVEPPNSLRGSTIQLRPSIARRSRRWTL